MTIPFTRDDFLALFSAYHGAFWPMPVVLTAIGVIGALRLGKLPKLGLVICAGLWLWIALAYFASFFISLSPLGFVFAALFVAEAFLLLHAAKQLTPRPIGESSRRVAILSTVLLSFGLVFYPLVGLAAGQRYPAMPTFGLPCPTTIFTFGVLAWWGQALPSRLLIIPSLWAIVGSSAALQFGIVEDLALIPAAVAVAAARAWARSPRTQMV